MYFYKPDYSNEINSPFARDNKNTFRLSGTFLPIINNTASEKAMSVAVGIAHPDIFSGLFILIRT